MSRPLSQSPILFALGAMAGVIVTYFGVNALIRPANALSWFEMAPPSGTAFNEEFFRLIMPVYGVRNIYTGLSIFSSVYYRQSKTLGWAILGSAGVAVADGIVCYQRGDGQWHHWGYAPQLVVLGSLLLGVFDSVVPAGNQKKD